MFVHLFCFLLIPHINEIIDHLSFSKLCHLAWYSLGPSMLLQMARFQWFLWPSNVSLYVYCAVLFLVIQLCPILCDTVDCSLPGSSVHGDSPGNNTEVGCHALLQGIFPTQGSNPGSPIILEWVFMPSSRGSVGIKTAQPTWSFRSTANWPAQTLSLPRIPRHHRGASPNSGVPRY